jgi:hypothetical protein
MLLSKRTALALSVAIVCVMAGAFIYALVINPMPAQSVPKVGLEARADNSSASVQLTVTRIQLPSDPGRQSLQWSRFSLSMALPGNATGTVNLGDLAWSGNETDRMSIMPGYYIAIRSSPGNVSGMRVGDVISICSSPDLREGEWRFSLVYFPPGSESSSAGIHV